MVKQAVAHVRMRQYEKMPRAEPTVTPTCMEVTPHKQPVREVHNSLQSETCMMAQKLKEVRQPAETIASVLQVEHTVVKHHLAFDGRRTPYVPNVHLVAHTARSQLLQILRCTTIRSLAVIRVKLCYPFP